VNALSRDAMAELDRLLVEEYGITVPRMMELAGLFSAELALKYMKGKRMLALVGPGHNGGDALSAVRHSCNKGVDAEALLALPPHKLVPESRAQYDILMKMRVPLSVFDPSSPPNWKAFGLLVDGLFGYNLKGSPRPPFSELIDQANASEIPILSIDLPSGLDADSGLPAKPCIRARATIALSGLKTGLLAPSAAPFVGDLYVSYMTVPLRAYARAGLKPPDFSKENVIRIR